MSEMLKGLLEGCVMQLIKEQWMYGYEITKKLQEMGFESCVEASIYTVLLRLEKKQLVDIDYVKSDLGPKRKVYMLNKSGKEQLQTFWENWECVESLVNKVKDNYEIR